MNKFRLTINALAVLVFTLACMSIAQAQATRTWVSGVGDDVNPCSRTAPCKTFAGAISKTAANGEIDSLDPAGFGAVTITKSITIDGGGTGSGFGGILAAGTNGVVVNDSASGSPNTIIVILRNLSINGAGTGIDGIRMLSGRQLYVENCTVFGFKGGGTLSNGLEIAINPGNAGVTFLVHVKNSTFENNSGDGINQAITAGTLNASYDNVLLAGNNNGLVSSGGTVNISRSVIEGNTANGISVSGGSIVNASSNQITSNATGVNCAAPSTFRLSDNNIYRNTSNGVAGGGTYVTFGNNRVIGNTGNEVLPAATAQK